MFLVTDRKATACGHGGSSGQHAQMAPRKKAGASKKQGQSKLPLEAKPSKRSHGEAPPLAFSSAAHAQQCVKK